MSNKFGHENLNRQEKVYTSTAAPGGAANPTKSVPVTREIKWVPECGYVIVLTKSGYISAAKHIFHKDIEKIFNHDKFVVEGYKYKFPSENITPKKREINFRKMNKISADIQLDYKRISKEMQERRDLVMGRVANAKNTYDERFECENGSNKKVIEVVFPFDFQDCFERILCLKYHQPDFLKATAVKTLFTECQ